jgi:hypothetical protein
MEVSAISKHSSLLQYGDIYSCKTFYSIGPKASINLTGFVKKESYTGFGIFIQKLVPDHLTNGTEHFFTVQI